MSFLSLFSFQSFWDIDIFLTAIEERKSDTVIREDKREYVVENCKIMV